MTNRLWKRAIFFLAALIAISMGFSAPGIGAELRPFDLPNQQQRPALPPSEGRQVDESVYLKFEERVKELKPEEKREWTESFKKKRDEAIKGERWDEVKHYQRLLEILKK